MALISYRAEGNNCPNPEGIDWKRPVRIYDPQMAVCKKSIVIFRCVFISFATSCYQLDTYRYENFVTNGRPAEVTFLLEHVWRITSDLG